MILLKDDDQSQERNAKSREDSDVCSFGCGIAFCLISAEGCACCACHACGIRGVDSAASNITGTGVSCWRCACDLGVTGSTCQADCRWGVGHAVSNTSNTGVSWCNGACDFVESGTASSANCNWDLGHAFNNNSETGSWSSSSFSLHKGWSAGCAFIVTATWTIQTVGWTDSTIHSC